MKTHLLVLTCGAIIGLVGTSIAAPLGDDQTWHDPRFFSTGIPIFASGYCDQPYVVVLPDGTWLCTFTTGAGHEGSGGQHIVATRSQDEGSTWSKPVKIEPDNGPAASWAMPYLTSFGRVYVFYDYNGDKVDRLPNSKRPIRDDMLGWYCFKYSDDGGLTWSQRHRLPVRTTACDRANQWGGKVHVLWGIGKPQHLRDGGMIFGFTKLGKYMLDDGEGWFFRSDNIDSEKDSRRLIWKNLPEGEHGVRHPDFGSVQEEHNLVELSDGTLFCAYRTTNGFCAYSTSKDRGSTWSLPEKMRYATGEVIPNPRACPRLFKCSNGRFLFWFENNHSKSFDHRNPAWLSGGIEGTAGNISWSQPDILIYSDDTSYHSGRFSYPDLIERDGQYWVTSTNKVEARIFPVQPEFLQGLWGQVDPSLALERTSPKPDAVWNGSQLASGNISLEAWDRSNAVPGYWIDPGQRARSLSLQLTVRLKTFTPNQVLFDARTPSGDGLLIATAEDARIEVSLRSGENVASWRTDKGFVTIGKKHHISVILDNGPGIIMGLVDSKFCDGSPEVPFGWHRYRDLDAVKNHRLQQNRPPARSIAPIPLNDSRSAKVEGTQLLSFGIYNRALTVSEAIGDSNARGSEE